jgi:membrane fusion protein, heavy metal efflux system
MKKLNKMKIIPSVFRVFAISISILLLSVISSCTNSATHDTGLKIEEPHKNDLTGQVSISRQQFEALKIEFGSIEQKNMRNNLRSTGFLKVPPEGKANITSALGGTVQSILVREGDKVIKGQTVVTLTNPEFIRMQEEFLEAQAQLIYAESEFNRQKELSEKNVASQKTFQQSQSVFTSLKAKFNSLKQQLAILNINTDNLTYDNISSFINVISPISGYVSNIEVNLGVNSEASKTLMNVVDNTHLHIDLFVFEQELPNVKVGQNVDFSLINLPGKSFNAIVFAVGSAFENETKTIPVHAEIRSDKTGLIEGMSVVGLINIEKAPVPSVLSSAIVSSSGNDYIFLKREEQVKQAPEINENTIFFERIQVKKGISDGSYTQITPLQEIPDKARVITNGAFYLMAILTNAGENE